MFTNTIGTPDLLLPDFTLPNALPGTAQWVSPFPTGNTGFTQLTLISLTGLLNCLVIGYRVPPGGAPALGNQFIPSIQIFAQQNVDYFYDSMNVLPAGYSLFFYASVVNGCNLAMHGYNWS